MSSSASLPTPSAAARWRTLRADALGLARAVIAPEPWLLMLAMLLCGSLAYLLAPFRFNLKVGGLPPDTPGCYERAIYDLPYLSGFNPDAEFDAPRARCATARLAYRWAFGKARLRLPGPGRAPLALTLRVAQGQAAASGWRVNQAPLLAVPLRPQPRSYHVLVPAQAAPDLDVAWTTPTFQPPGDDRALAFAVEGISVVALGRVAPAWQQLGSLALIVGLSYGLVRRWSAAPRLALLLGALLVVVLTALLAWQRTGLTLVTPYVVRLLLAAIGLNAALAWLIHGLARRLRIGASLYEVRLITGLVVLAWLIRTVGLLHPQAYSSDTGLHVNNLIGVMRGSVIFPEDLPSEAGGGPAPYPPAQYVMLAPLALLNLPDETLIVLGNALADSGTIVGLWLLLRSAGAPADAAFGAGALYLFATPSLRSLSTGEMANVWGQALVVPWLLALLLWRNGRIAWPVLAVATAVVLLGHFGVFFSVLLFAGTLSVIWLVRRDPHGWRLAAMVGGVLLLMVAGYYSAFTEIILQRSAAPPATTTALQRIGFELDEFWRPLGLIGPLMTAWGFGGLALIWRRYPLLGQIGLAWCLSVVLSWASLLRTQQALRWELFVFPALALAGGVLFMVLRERGRVRRSMADVLLTATVVYGGALWVARLIDYGH